MSIVDKQLSETIDELRDYTDTMNQKELDFFNNVSGGVFRDLTLTPNQRQWLFDIWGKYVK